MGNNARWVTIGQLGSAQGLTVIGDLGVLVEAFGAGDVDGTSASGDATRDGETNIGVGGVTSAIRSSEGSPSRA